MKLTKTTVRAAALLLAVLLILTLSACGNSVGLDRKATYTAVIEVAGYGSITVLLDQKAAPTTCANFVSLAENVVYDGTTFHRIMEGFMIQGGDPTGTGSGGSGTTIKGEFSANGVKNSLLHTRGTISMARNSLSYDSASSQFFIVQQDAPHLDGQYAAFGCVTDGMDVVDAIAADAVPTDNNGTSRPEEQPVITSITIVRED